MADDTNARKAGQNDQDAKRPKRMLRTNSETVRERTEKLQQQAAVEKKPSFLRTFFSGFFWPLRAFGRQLAKLGRFRVFRWISYVFVPPYVRNSWRELRQVTWPDRRTTFRLTWAVIVFSIIFGLVVFGVDLVLDKVFKEIIVN